MWRKQALKIRLMQQRVGAGWAPVLRAVAGLGLTSALRDVTLPSFPLTGLGLGSCRIPVLWWEIMAGQVGTGWPR